MKVLFVHNCPTEFVKIDRELLSRRFEVREMCCRPNVKFIPQFLTMPAAVAWADVVVCWFASWHAVEPTLLARLLRKRRLLIVGGYDTANLPEIDYGHQRGGVRKAVSSWLIRQATELIVNSHYSAGEVRAQIPQLRLPVRVVHHGIRDAFGEVRDKVPNRVITVGNINRSNLLRKGIRDFCEASHFVPEAEFVAAGRHVDDSARYLRSIAAGNVQLPGYLNDQDLTALYRSASVYVQPSRHEAFGLSVAESMLAGCIPVVSDRGSLPEVVGDCGIVLHDCRPQAIAEAIRTALGAATQERLAARNRILSAFPMGKRDTALANAVTGQDSTNNRHLHCA